MSYYSRISDAFRGALRLPLTKNSKYVLFSDCHRGIGSTGDNFLKNEFIYLAAIKYYYEKQFTYIELGDGDELWENRSLNSIKEMHHESFAVLSKYYQNGRFFSLYGNHDIVKKSNTFCSKNYNSYYCRDFFCTRPLFPNIKFYSGIILEDLNQHTNIYLTHGHQADFLNSTLWPLSRFLVRYLWRFLEDLGIPDPTSAAKNNTKKKKSEKLLTYWAEQNHNILITGHTHNPMIGTKQSPYFNTGSCISPNGITCIEIENRCMVLSKWALGTKENQDVFVKREILGNKICLDDF